MIAQRAPAPASRAVETFVSWRVKTNTWRTVASLPTDVARLSSEPRQNDHRGKAGRHRACWEDAGWLNEFRAWRAESLTRSVRRQVGGVAFMEAPRVRRFGGAHCVPSQPVLHWHSRNKKRERKGLMDNTRLIDLAMKAFALGLCEGHELADQQLGVRVRTGRSLMQKLLPTTSNTLPREYRMQLRLVYGAGFHLGQWRKFNGLNSNGGEEVRGEDPA